MSTEGSPWSPPFCAKETDLECPKCGEGSTVLVRESEYYQDGDTVEAYCDTCHADLEVMANVSIEFSDPDVAP